MVVVTCHMCHSGSASVRGHTSTRVSNAPPSHTTDTMFSEVHCFNPLSVLLSLSFSGRDSHRSETRRYSLAVVLPDTDATSRFTTAQLLSLARLSTRCYRSAPFPESLHHCQPQKEQVHDPTRRKVLPPQFQKKNNSKSNPT